MNLSAAKRGTGISSRTPEYINEKMDSGLAVLALDAATGEWIGFCCIEVWEHKGYIANTGLIISSKYRGNGISKEIKTKLFELQREKFPHAKIFSLTTCPAVIHINAELGYKRVAFEKVMSDPLFHEGCNSWVDYKGLMERGPESGYVAMVFEPAAEVALVPSFSSHWLGKLKRIRKSKRQYHRQGQFALQPVLSRWRAGGFLK